MQLEPWKQMVLDSLEELSDASFQDRAWIRRDGPEISSPSEAVNQLFDDSGLSDLLENGVVFSAQADLTLRQLSKYVDALDFEQSAEALLDDVRWSKVRELASQARREVEAALHRE